MTKDIYTRVYNREKRDTQAWHYKHKMHQSTPPLGTHTYPITNTYIRHKIWNIWKVYINNTIYICIYRHAWNITRTPRTVPGYTFTAKWYWYIASCRDTECARLKSIADISNTQNQMSLDRYHKPPISYIHSIRDYQKSLQMDIRMHIKKCLVSYVHSLRIFRIENIIY